MKRKTVVIIIVIVVIILLAISAWLVYKKYFKKQTGDLEDDQVIPPDYSGAGGYSSGGSGSYTTPASFPIKKGMSGGEVTDIQNAINKKCKANITADGAFGPKTEAALKSCYNTTTVSQSLFTQMKLDSAGAVSGCPEGQYKIPGLGCVPITGSTTVAPTGFQKGNMLYQKMSGTVLFKNADGSTSFGKIASSHNNNNPIGAYLSSYKGFTEIMISTGYTGLNGGQINNTPTRAYVYTSLIRK